MCMGFGADKTFCERPNLITTFKYLSIKFRSTYCQNYNKNQIALKNYKCNCNFCNISFLIFKHNFLNLL